MKVKKAEPSHLHMNLTAMLDVVFNLIFFFICICNMAGNELPKLDVPRPEESRARVIEERKKVTVNVLPNADGSGSARSIRVGADEVFVGDEERLTQLLRAKTQLNPDIEIDLRVDKNIHYAAVQPVMNAITRAGITKVNLVAFLSRE